jgi:membrane protein YdbS with pleckstrin-like domain
MAAIKFRCPGCEAINEGEPEVMGTTVECNTCGAPLQVPEAPRKPLMAQLLDDPEPVSPSVATPEGDLFFLRPVRRGFLGTAAAVVVMLVATLTVLVWASQKDFSKLFSLIPLGVALYLAWRLFYLTRSVAYRLTSQRLFIQIGLIGRKQEEIELFRITDVSLEQTPMERILRIGTILVNSTDESMPLARLENVPDPGRHKDILRDAYRAARTREGMRAGEFIGGM